MILHSIKWRLQIWHSFLLVSLVAGLMAGFYTYERQARFQVIDSELAEATEPLMPRFAPPGELERGLRGPPGRGRPPPPGVDGRPPPPEEGFPDEGPPEDQRGDFGRTEDRPPRNGLLGRGREPERFDAKKIYFVAWSKDGEQLAASTNAPSDVPCPRSPDSKQPRLVRTRGTYRELARFVPSGRCVLVGMPLSPTLAHLQNLALAMALIGGGIVVTGLAVGWWLATRALRPIAEISEAAREIAAGDLSKRINPSERESELGQLAAVLNSTFARLDAAFAQQKQFTSDAAHELRTPVSVILTQTQSTLNKERGATEYRETLEACQRAAQRMKRLIESLLQLARLDAGQENFKREELDLAHTAADCLDLVRPLAVARRVTLQSDFQRATCRGDNDRLALVVTNLLTNAIHHGKEGGAVRVATQNGESEVSLSVTDDGPGIPPEHLPHVFERFYRADAARTSAEGRSGLGLAISKAIVEAHGGALEVTSQPGAGATFTLRLPGGAQ